MKRKQNIIKRMIETYQMWQVARYVRLYHFDLVELDHTDRQTISELSMTEKYLTDSMESITATLLIGCRGGDPTIPIDKIATSMAAKSLNLEKVKDEMHLAHEYFSKETAKKLLIIKSALEMEYLAKNAPDSRYVHLTLKGKRFSTRYGLVKEWALVDIGRFWFGILSAVFAFLIAHWSLLWGFGARMSPWW